MQQESTAIPPTPETVPASPKRRRGAFIAGAVLVVLVAGGLAVGLSPNHLGVSLPGSSAAAPSAGTSDPQKTGCPIATANATWPHPPTKTLHFADAGSDTTIQTGDVVQIDLPATLYRWTLSQITGKAATALSPAGYYDAANDTCDWRFTTQGSGASLIQFLRRRNCAPKTICSDIQVEAAFTITVP